MSCSGREAPRSTARRTDRPSRIVVAFSGGPDSTALLAAIASLAPCFGLEPVAAHYDHALDPGSEGRAEAARVLARELDVPFVCRRRTRRLRRGRGNEAAARERRYAFLDATRRKVGAECLAVAHHRDDQVETILLRILGGTGIAGLAGMRPRSGPLLRPLLDVSRSEIEAYVAALGLAPVVDPTNRSPTAHRNRVRHSILPVLRRTDPRLESVLVRLGQTAANAGERIDRILSAHCAEPAAERGAHGPAASTSLTGLRDAPSEIRPFLLARLHRAAGAEYPPRSPAVTELARQIERTAQRIRVDCGDGWCWRGGADRLVVERSAPAGAPITPLFAYTLRVPGVVEVPEIAAYVRIRRERTKPWMFRGSPTRAALALPLEDGATLEIRNRRPGDRLQPLGCDYERRLKEILIDDKVPHRERSRIPLLVHEGRVAWIPGITIDERYRVRNEDTVWTASLHPRASRPART